MFSEQLDSVEPVNQSGNARENYVGENRQKRPTVRGGPSSALTCPPLSTADDAVAFSAFTQFTNGSFAQSKCRSQNRSSS
jgi:hypothetical protein